MQLIPTRVSFFVVMCVLACVHDLVVSLVYCVVECADVSVLDLLGVVLASFDLVVRHLGVVPPTLVLSPALCHCLLASSSKFRSYHVSTACYQPCTASRLASNLVLSSAFVRKSDSCSVVGHLIISNSLALYWAQNQCHFTKKYLVRLVIRWFVAR